MRKLSVLLFVVALITAHIAVGYDNIILHPKFAREAAAVYNLTGNRELTSKQVNWIVSGSIKEDAAPRYFNHFYEYRTGMGYLLGLPASEWSQLQDIALGDFSEGAILESYKKGNEQLAYIGVGHQVHLIEDMAVPAHTRNDPHNPDPYENWCQKNNPALVSSSIVKIDNLRNSIIELAKFTGNNFYSEDALDGTIKFDKKIVENGIEYAIKNNYKLAALTDVTNGYLMSLDESVHQDYINQLAPKAIGYSAGVIDYFQRKFTAIDEERKSENKVVAFFKSLINFLPDSNSDTAIAWGDAVNVLDIKEQLALNDSLREQVMNDAVLRNDINNSLLASDPTRDIANAKVVNAVRENVQKTKVLGEKITSKIGASSTGEKLSTNITTPETIFEVGGVGEGDVTKPKTTFKIINPANAQELIDLEAPSVIPRFPFTFSSGGSSNNQPANTEPIVIPEPIIYPVTTFVSNPPLLGSSSMAFFVFGSDQASSSYQYRLDAASSSDEWQVTSDTRLATSVGDGVHSIEVRANYKGVSDETPIEYSWTVDTTAPTSTIQPLAPYHNQPTYNLNWDRSDLASDNAYFDIEYAINDKDWLPYLAGTTSTSSVFAQSVQAGDYVHFRIRACDELQNCEAWPSVEQVSTRVGPIAPSPVTLTSDALTQNSAKIDWQAPVDGHLSAEAKYDLRYQKKLGVCNLSATWEMASSASNLPAVATISGEVVTVTITDLEPGTTYCTALRTYNGFNWSTTSDTLEFRTDCVVPTNIIPSYSVKQGVANNVYGPAGVTEPVLLVTFFQKGMGYRTLVGSTCTWDGPVFTLSSNSAYGSVEYEYSTSTLKFTGRFRFCGNGYSGNFFSWPDANGFCEDRPTWWGNGRWMMESKLTGQSKISVIENKTGGAATEWLTLR